MSSTVSPLIHIICFSSSSADLIALGDDIGWKLMADGSVVSSDGRSQDENMDT